ncbi:MAG: sulfatase-like hydrolase/transferase [bacterium]|nr:sulfatase-like hydrolase/transferase [bacterium]
MASVADSGNLVETEPQQDEEGGFPVQATEVPNVLFVITDQQRADHVGFSGNGTVRTPAIDSIAERGMVFDNAWVSNPICMPNRSTIVTGRMPSAHGVVFNDRSLEWQANTFVRVFRAGGWRTGLFGKSHFQHGMSRLISGEADLAPAVFSSANQGWDELEHAEHYLDEPPEFPESFYGFENVELSIDHGARVTGHHMNWAIDRGGSLEDLFVPLDSTAPASRRSELWWQIYDPPYPPELHSSAFVADRTINFIEESARRQEPWLAWASFPDPHHPMTPPGEWFDRHSPADMAVPTTIDDPLDGAPDFLRRLQNTTVDQMLAWVGLTGATSRELVKECVAATYGMIELIDECVRRILATVEKLGQTNTTIVVFTSDHGDMMGDHGLLLKGLMHYRGVLQVPLVIAGPGLPPGRTMALASSIDLGPTLMEMCGLAPYEGIQGQSLVSLLSGSGGEVRDSVLIEDDVPAFAGRASSYPGHTRTIVTRSHRYTRHSTGEEQLFDLANDPDELTDLSNRDEGTRTLVLEQLLDSMLAHSDWARCARS